MLPSYNDCTEFRSRSSSRSTNSSKSENDEKIHCSFVDQVPLGQGKFLTLNSIKYRDPSGKERSWEAVTRTTCENGEADDSVGIIAFYHRLLHYDQMILVKQYRPALKCYTIEMPTGLLDPGDAPERVALRELKEETGYVGEVKHVGPLVASDPGVSDCTMHLVTATINGDAMENFHSKGTSEEERIEIIMMPTQDLLNKLNELGSQGYVVDSRVYAFAIGLQMGSKHMRKRSRHEQIVPTLDIPGGNRLQNNMPV